MNVYIFGLGQGKKYLDRCLREDVHVCGYIDNYKAEKIGIFDGKPIVRQNDLRDAYDYIIITLMEYKGVRDSLLSDGVERSRLISFFDFEDASEERHWEVIDAYKWRVELMWKHYIGVVMPSVDNIGYELYADSELVKRDCPKIIDVESTVNLICDEKKSLARFGDNEFELMCGRLRVNYQDVDDKLAGRLKEVLNSDEDNLLIAIADNYGSLEKYTDEAAGDIRAYMSREVRKNHMELLDLSRQYYNAYLSRPYIIFRDKENAESRFKNIKRIWDDKDVLIVEGEHTRFGVGNKLLNNARNIERIIVPDKNAFQRYDEMKEFVCKYGEGKLILAIIGPTATVLAYDLAKEGYWIIDIGQLDTEYEWFLRGVKKKCNINYKNVSETARYEPIDASLSDSYLKVYNSEIIQKIV